MVLVDTQEIFYEPEQGEKLSTAVVMAVAEAHGEDAVDQTWRISDDIDTDALDDLFEQPHQVNNMQFRVDSVTATISSDPSGKLVIKIEPSR